MAEAGTLFVAPARVSVSPRVTTRVKVYIFLLVFTLPMDFFQPTAALLREGGAKPAIPLMAAGAAWIFWRHWVELMFYCPKLWRTILLLCVAITVLGAFAFVANIGTEISYWDGMRNPGSQFVTQGAIFVIVAPVLIAHAWLFSRPEVRPLYLRFIPTTTVLHLLVIAAQWVGLLRDTAFPLTLFRGAFVPMGSRPSGLMTEQSYVGNFAAMNGLALLLCMPMNRRRNRVLGMFSMCVALIMGGKTLVPALLVGLIAYAYQARMKLLDRRVLAGFAGVAVITVYLALTYSVLDVRVNLSSAMRIGSTLLALNAAAAGYGLLGIGFGQFHFIYTPRFAPGFLMYSYEAQRYFARTFDVRASTYDLPARFLIEAGILGLILFLSLILLAFRNGRAHDDLWHRCGAVITGSSLGFLLTQDTYFFPAFVCGAAILVSRPPRN